MSKLMRSVLAGLALFALACSSTPTLPQSGSPEVGADAEGPILILVSLDGFRWDFLERGETPTLARLAAEGVHARRLIPSFPSKTFPNHYTLVTGLRPAEHGLVANNIWDPATEKLFGLSNRVAVGTGAWYGGEPIWVTAERRGIRTAPLFWPGSEAEILGVRPSYHQPYDGDMTPEARVDLILKWLELPPPERPGFLTLYFEDVDDAAHTFGPEPSAELAGALGVVDRAMARLVEGLERRGLDDRVDLLVVSDHGMASTSPERVILLDDYIDLETANVVDWNPVLGLWPSKENLDRVYEALAGAHSHLTVVRREEIPDRFEFAGHERIPPIVGIADEGWSISSSSDVARCPRCFDGGTHGYDHRLESMGALLVARGPSFRRATKIGPIENFHLYNAMCIVLGLDPAPNSGDPARVWDLVTPREPNTGS